MAWVIWHPIKIYLTNDELYYLTNQLMIVVIDNYYVLFMFSAIYIHKKHIYIIILHIIKELEKSISSEIIMILSLNHC